MKFITTIVGLSLVCASTAAYAEEDLQRVAIQERKHQLAHEFRLSLGTMPLDAYQKSWTVSLGYTTHLTKYLAWEVVQVSFAYYLASTDLREQLIDAFAVPPEDFAAPRLMATTGLELSPFYGKQAFLNDKILHQGLLGGVYAGLIFGDRVSFGDTLTDIRPTVGIGLGYRLYANDLWSFRADIRDFFSFRRAVRDNEQFELENVLFITISASINVWRDDA